MILIGLDDFECAAELAGSGPHVTFLHSVGLSTRDGWRSQVPEFSRSFTTLCFDFRGLGQSSRGARRLSVDQYVADIESLLQHPGATRTAIVGASLGGFVAQAFALKRPDLASALVLVSTTCAHLPGHAQRRADRAARIRREGMGSEVETQIRNRFSPQFIADNPDVMDWRRRHYLDNDPDAYADVLYDLGRKDFSRRLGEIACPTLVVGGDSDQNVVAGRHPLDSPMRIRALVPGANLAIMPGSRHYPQIDNPELFNAIVIPFLKHSIAPARPAATLDARRRP